MSFKIRNALTLGAFSALAAAQTVPPKLDATCADVVIFMARGNDAPYHDGRTFPFVEATCGKLTAQGKSCDYIDIQFDVTLGGDYCNQVAEGAMVSLRLQPSMRNALARTSWSMATQRERTSSVTCLVDR